MKLLMEKWPFLSLHVSARFLRKQTQQGFHLTNWLNPQSVKTALFILITLSQRYPITGSPWVFMKSLCWDNICCTHEVTLAFEFFFQPKGYISTCIIYKNILLYFNLPSIRYWGPGFKSCLPISGWVRCMWFVIFAFFCHWGNLYLAKAFSNIVYFIYP